MSQRLNLNFPINILLFSLFFQLSAVLHVRMAVCVWGITSARVCRDTPGGDARKVSLPPHHLSPHRHLFVQFISSFFVSSCFLTSSLSIILFILFSLWHHDVLHLHHPSLSYSAISLSSFSSSISFNKLNLLLKIFQIKSEKLSST